MSGDGDGWTLKVPTRTLTQDGNDWATTITRYDTQGRVIETRTPGGTAITDGSANDTYSTKTIYYTTDGSASNSACRNTPEWDGNTCLTKTAGNPATGYPLPTTTTTGYSIYGAATRLEETADTWTRATITGYDYLGRESSGSTALTGHTTISGTTSHDTTTGAVTSTTRGGVTENYTYDTWGRTLTTTDGTGNTATTTYNTAGQVATFNDGKGTYTYTYNGTDNQGHTEHRGLITTVDLGYTSGNTDQITGAYDTAGNLTEQTLPGDYTQTWTRNLAGQATSMAYTQDIAGTATPVVGFTQTYDHLGRVVAATGPAGNRAYTYDDRARLTKVKDTTSIGCTTRTYAFTGDSNRTSLTTYNPDVDGTCQTTTAASTENYSYDQADRITNTGYTYDRMGRTTTVPKNHTNQNGVTAASDLAVTYAANDMVATLTQTTPNEDTGTGEVHKQTFTLDATDRISTTKTYIDTVQLGETTNHYDGSGDSPAWTQTKTRPDASTAWDTTWNRYLSDLTGGLAIDLNNDNEATLQLANLHGDIVATTTIGTPGIDTYTETDEYGQPTTDTTLGRYSWLGTHQRDTNTTGGLTLMGARLYAPTTGLFLSIDPIPGGNENRYTHPADPINTLDLDGRCGMSCKKIRGVFGGVIGRIGGSIRQFSDVPKFIRRTTSNAGGFIYVSKQPALTVKVGRVIFRRYPNVGGGGISFGKRFRIDYHKIGSLGPKARLHVHLKTKAHGMSAHRLLWPVNGRWVYSK